MERPSEIRYGPLIAGLALIGIGLLLLLDRLWIVDVEGLHQLWPLIVIAVGVARLARGGEGRHGGLVVVAVGAWLLLNTLGLFGLDWSDSWPLVVIFIGLAKIAAPGEEGRAGGVLMLLIGAWMLVNVLRIGGLDWETTWSIPIVIAGIFIVWRALAGDDADDDAGERREASRG